MPPDQISTLDELRRLSPRQIEEARRDGRLDLAALSAEQNEPEAERIRLARIRLGLDVPTPSNQENTNG